MSELVADCPRCGSSKITFNLLSSTKVGVRYDWQVIHEAFCVCRRCHRSTVFVLTQTEIVHKHYLDKTELVNIPFAVNEMFRVEDYVSLKDSDAESPPEFLPSPIETTFTEGAKCLAIGCFNASAAMYRLCLDMATNELLPTEDVDGLNAKIRRSLGFRLDWLFNTGRLPEALRELSLCVKDDGNDGAHEGTLGKADAEDLHDFTYTLLERLYTEPERLKQAKARREARRKQ